MSSTTTTYVDLTDAPMLDYSVDPDFSMHPGWLTIEATMSDETNSMQDATLHDYAESIEVDMEPHVEDEEMTEYEMADEEAVDQNQQAASQDAELLDIEVIDPSQAATPTLVSLLPTPTIPTSALVRQSLTPVLAVFEPTPLATAESYNTVPTDDYTAVVPDSSFDFHHTQAHSPSPHLTVGAGMREQLPTAPDTSNDVGPTDVPPAVAEGSTPTTSEERATTADDLTNQSAEVLEAAANSDATEEVVSESIPAPQDEAPQADAQQESVVYNEGNGEVITAETGEETHYSNGDDPHEVSDGVYIDPPPAVLISITSTGGSLECSMFNQPHASSRSQSPNGYASSSTSTELVLLLHQQPTLYYEPLSNVFEALRQEERVHIVSDLADSELVLEAYDLDLRITEDNIHAREVTIHELNILHDGIDLRGPLRLRLSSSTPRFITRYHALRDQIAQLSLEINGEAPTYDEAEHYEHYTEPTGEYDSVHEDSLAETGEQHDVVYSEHGEVVAHEFQDDVPYEEEVPTEKEPDHPLVNAEETGESTNEDRTESEEQQEAYDQAAGEIASANADHADEAFEEYGTEVAIEESLEGLDADEVHRSADAEDDGNYTDYAQNVGDVDEGFDANLPEEAGSCPPADAPYADATDAADAPEEDEEGEIVDPAESAPALGQTSVEETEASEATYDEVNDSPDVPHTDSYEAGEVLDNDSFEDVTSPQTQTNNNTNADPAEIEQLEEYDDSDSEDAPNRAEDVQDDAWDELQDPDTYLESMTDTHENDDALSKDSSVTLSSARSKRSREEDDEVEEVSTAPDSPDTKRARVH